MCFLKRCGPAAYSIFVTSNNESGSSAIISKTHAQIAGIDQHWTIDQLILDALVIQVAHPGDQVSNWCWCWQPNDQTKHMSKLLSATLTSAANVLNLWLCFIKIISCKRLAIPILALISSQQFLLSMKNRFKEFNNESVESPLYGGGGLKEQQNLSMACRNKAFSDWYKIVISVRLLNPSEIECDLQHCNLVVIWMSWRRS